jgi:hypothetical protein
MGKGHDENGASRWQIFYGVLRADTGLRQICQQEIRRKPRMANLLSASFTKKIEAKAKAL